ncbi:MAG: HlyU family transcriptional regulator [Pseudomonadota bacterium]
MSLLSRLFSKPAPKAPDPILHKDCRIFAQPVAASGGYRVAARIEIDLGCQTKTHLLQRADTCSSLQEATDLSVAKAKQAIDQLGAALFA